MNAYELFKINTEKENQEKQIKRYFLDRFETNSVFLLKNFILSSSDILSIKKDIKKIHQNFPIEYLTNKKFFNKNYFFVDSRTLIPRPETEEMTIIAIKYIKENSLTKAKVLDMGTGSGCIGISIKNEFANADVLCTDVSRKTLQVTKINSEKISQVKILKSNLFSKIKEEKFNIIISNPPYVQKNFWRAKKALHFEPKGALVWKKRRSFYDFFIEQFLSYTTPSFFVVLEINEHDKNSIENLLRIHKIMQFSRIQKDIFGKNRFLIINK